MNKEEMRENILLNYDLFLDEQKMMYQDVKNKVSPLLESYIKNYKDYFSNDLDSASQKAYQKNIEEIDIVKNEIQNLNDILEFFGLTTEEMMVEHIETLQFLRDQNDYLKNAENNVENINESSGPQKENFNKKYRYTFLIVLAKLIFIIAVFVIAYIQIKNRPVSFI